MAGKSFYGPLIFLTVQRPPTLGGRQIQNLKNPGNKLLLVVLTQETELCSTCNLIFNLKTRLCSKVIRSRLGPSCRAWTCSSGSSPCSCRTRRLTSLSILLMITRSFLASNKSDKGCDKRITTYSLEKRIVVKTRPQRPLCETRFSDGNIYSIRMFEITPILSNQQDIVRNPTLNSPASSAPEQWSLAFMMEPSGLADGWNDSFKTVSTSSDVMDEAVGLGRAVRSPESSLRPQNFSENSVKDCVIFINHNKQIVPSFLAQLFDFAITLEYIQSQCRCWCNDKKGKETSTMVFYFKITSIKHFVLIDPRNMRSLLNESKLKEFTTFWGLVPPSMLMNECNYTLLI